MRQGRSAGGLSYGYRIVRTIGPDGAPTTGEREVDAKEAKVVRDVFAAFASGKSPRAIAKDLNASQARAANRGARRQSMATGGAAPEF